MKRSPTPLRRQENRRFVIRALLLLALIGLLGWAGWFAPWSRVDARVDVEVLNGSMSQ